MFTTATAIIVFSSLLVSFGVEGQPCSHCVCKTDKGTLNLTSLSSTDNSKPFFDGVKDAKSFTYQFNPCSPFTCGKDTNSAVCQKGHDTPAYSCGESATESLVVDNGEYILHYAGGENGRNSEILLVCNKTAEEPVLIAEGDKDKTFAYKFRLTSKCACPGECNHDPNEKDQTKSKNIPVGIAGTTILSLLVVVILCYFVAGMIVSAIHLGKRGTDIVPHKAFWLGFAGLVKDGCMFSVMALCRRNTRLISGYQKL